MKIVLGIIFLCFAHVTLGQNDFFLPPGVELSAAQLKDLAEDALLTAPELIEKNGYPVEVHHVDSNGYILEMHRIPYGKKSGPAQNKPIAFVQHGVLSSSADWILTGPEKGLGYILADAGYDVWMGNFRGNTYSRHHHSLSPSNGKFWDFSWHELGVEDLPNMIDYVLAHTGQKQLFYIGHSQGTTSFFVMCSQRPEYNSKIRAMFSLAPIAYMNHMRSPLIQIIAKAEGFISTILNLLGIHEFLPSSELMAQAGDAFCNDDAMTQMLCRNALFVLCGFNKDNLNATLLPVLMGHTPAGSSTNQMLHYAQEVNSGYFRQYDYGLLKNLYKYGHVSPPQYDLKKVTAPVALHYGRNDWLASVSDVDRLKAGLANPIGKFVVMDDNFNHLDFLWGNNAYKSVYSTVLNLMMRY